MILLTDDNNWNYRSSHSSAETASIGKSSVQTSSNTPVSLVASVAPSGVVLDSGWLVVSVHLGLVLGVGGAVSTAITASLSQSTEGNNQEARREGGFEESHFGFDVRKFAWNIEMTEYNIIEKPTYFKVFYSYMLQAD